MRRAFTTSLLFALVAAPLATADWGMQGSYEPDTSYDVTGGFMWADPDTVPSNDPAQLNKVYFNGWLGMYPLQPTNPNLASARTMHSYSHMRFWAAMGDWKDCNKDGYVGLGDQGLFEYRSELLVGDTSVCPALQGGVPANRPFGWKPPHNDGQWVHEFIPIAWNRAGAETGGDVDPFNYNDNQSRIWVDGGRPGDAVRQGCVINPQPRDTYHSTGGMIEYADCLAKWRATDSWNNLTAELNADSLGAGQLSFADKPRDQSHSNSRLNVRNPWGDEHEASFVQPWNCAADQTHVGTPAAGAVPATNVINVSQPRSSPGTNAAGTPSGTANETASGFDECERTANGSQGPNGQDHYGRTLARAPYSQESDRPNTPLKNTPLDWFSPHETARPAAPWQVVLGRGAPGNFGSTHVEPDLGTGFVASGFWMGDRTNHVNPYFVNREDFTANPVQHFTYYGFVSTGAITTNGLSLRATATSTYGREVCGSAIGPGAAPKLGWSCDPTSWNIDANGVPVETTRDTYLGEGEDVDGDGDKDGVLISVPVGQPYNLRDIDCYDESVTQAREAKIGWGVVTGTDCSYAAGSLLPVVG